MSQFDAQKQLLVRAVENGNFGDYELDALIREDAGHTKKGPQFMSNVLFLTIRLRHKVNKDNVREEEVAVKLQRDDEASRTMMNTGVLFANEALMYMDILFELGAEACGLFPKCFYSHSDGGANYRNDIIVLENLTPQGYRLPKHRVFLDWPHLQLALHKIGQFHGLSYAFKHKHGNEALVNKLQPTKFSQSSFHEKKFYLVHSTKKYGASLVALGYDEALFKKLLERYEDPQNFFTFISRPQEPFAVICHGDFNRNNLLFKYASNGDPTDVKFIDLQNSVYGDPTLDLAFFLYMNTTRKMRLQRWNDLLKTYWEGVQVTALQPGFTFDEFVDNFDRKAFVGFIHVTFFLPLMLANRGEVAFTEYLKLSNEGRLNMFNNTGGQEAFEAVRDVLRDLVDRQCVQNIL